MSAIETGGAEHAIEQGRDARAAGDMRLAAAWFHRAHRLTSGHPTVVLLLAAAVCEAEPERARALLDELLVRHPECHDGWVALLAVHVRLRAPEAAAVALDGFLRMFRPPEDAAFRKIAGEISQLAGAPGWCGLSAAGRLTVGCAAGVSQRDVIAGIDGVVVAGRRFVARHGVATCALPEAWRAGYRLAVRLGERALLGSGMQLARWQQSSGFVEHRDGAGLVGQAWLPADPGGRPGLSLIIERDGASQHLPIRMAAQPAALADGQTAYGFVVDKAQLAGAGRVRVVAEAGLELWGSPLYPHAEHAAAEASARALGAALRPGGAGRAKARPVDVWRPFHAGPPPARRGAAARGKQVVPPCDVIIPVHNGAADVRACLDSVWRSVMPHGSRVIIVDDGSTDPELLGWLQECAAAGRIVLVRPKARLGFPGAVNAGLAASEVAHDVVLLNSDTLVPGGWLGKLARAAHASGDGGSVTPLSNDGSIAAAGRVVELADIGAVEALDALCGAANRGGTVELPTGVGFCMYLTRACLEATGGFRPDLFAQGYGEENDWCMRARVLGFRHVLATDVFVAHSGGRTFGAAKSFLLRRNGAILNRLHPGYAALAEAGGFREAIRLAWRAIDLQRWRVALTGARCVVLITHRLGGGVQRFVDARCAEFARAGVRALVLCPPDPAAEPAAVFECELQDASGDLAPLGFSLPLEFEALCGWLSSFQVQSVEVHHLLGHHALLRDVASLLAVPMYVTIHDYGYWCPRFNLVSHGAQYCGEPADPMVCDHCVADLGSPVTDLGPVAAYRADAARLLGEARAVIVSSDDAQARMARHFPGLRTVQRRWAEDAPAAQRIARKAVRGMHQVVVVGAIGPEKGYDVLLACARDAALRDLPLQFNVVGFTTDDRRLLETGRVFITGRYREPECQALLEGLDAGLGFLPSVWPETWCFALSALFEAGLDVVAFDLGTQAERIAKRAGGVLLPPGTAPASINRAMLAYFAQARA